MQTEEHLEQYKRITGRQAEEFLDRAVKLVQENLPEFTGYFPDSNSKGSFYPQTENREWTTGFWTGEIWLAYERTKEEALKKAGLLQVKSFLKRITDRVDVDHHIHTVCNSL